MSKVQLSKQKIIRQDFEINKNPVPSPTFLPNTSLPPFLGLHDWPLPRPLPKGRLPFNAKTPLVRGDRGEDMQKEKSGKEKEKSLTKEKEWLST